MSIVQDGRTGIIRGEGFRLYLYRDYTDMFFHSPRRQVIETSPFRIVGSGYSYYQAEPKCSFVLHRHADGPGTEGSLSWA